MSGIDGKTISCLHFDEEYYLDKTKKEWIPYGQPQLNNSIKKIGDNSLYLNGSSYLQTNMNESIDFLANDFTVEWWEYRTAAANDTGGVFEPTSTTQYIPHFGYLSSSVPGKVICVLSSNGTSYDILSLFSLGTYDLNKWNHFALVRKKSTFYGFKNGTLTGTVNSSLSIKSTSGMQWGIGSGYNGDGPRPFSGYLSGLRVSNIARYIANFTPQETQYELDSNTLILLDLNKYQSKDEINLNTWASNGFPVALKQQNKFNKSLYLDGSSYLKSKVGFNFGTDDFTIDFWVYPTVYNTGSFPAIFDWVTTTDSNVTFAFHQQHSFVGGKSCFVTPSGKQLTYDPLPLNTWTHIAIVRKNGIVTYYFNGKKVAYAEYKDNINIDYLCIGSNNGVDSRGYYIGYIDEFRISKCARWNNDFVLPTLQYSKLRYLVKTIDNHLHTFKDSAWVDLGAAVDNTTLKNMFMNNEVIDPYTKDQISLLTNDKVKQCIYQEDINEPTPKATVISVPAPQFVQEKQDVELKYMSFLDWVHINDSITNFEVDNGKVKAIVSRDSGKTWQVYNTTTSAWETILDSSSVNDGTFDASSNLFTPTDAGILKANNSGMTVDIFNAAAWNDYTIGNGYKTIKVAYMLSQDLSTDVALVDSLKYQYDGIGDWVLAANFNHYKVQTRNNSHTITWLTPIDGKRVKINY